MKQSIFLFLFCGTLLSATAQKKFQYTGYSGSMFIHSGVIKSNSFNVTNQQGEVSAHEINHAEFGMGGKIAFSFNKGIRFGLEGYSSRTNYGDFRSTFAVNWGGLLVDYIYVDRVVSYFAGVTLGGGQAVNTVVTKPQHLNYTTSDILRRKYVVGMLVPFAGLDVRLSSKFLITLKADYMQRFTNTYDDWGKGFRIYLGMTLRPQMIRN